MVEAGLPVVVDKPLGVDASEALAVVDAARQAGVPLTVFQNRRYDAEHATMRDVVRSGQLGEVFRAEMRWERWRPTPKDRWRENAPPTEGGGIMLDLQTHVVDAAVDLFGPVETVYAQVFCRTTTSEDDAFLACRHESGAVSHLGTTSVAAAPGPRIRVLGRQGAFVLNAFERDLDIYPDLRTDDDHCGWVFVGDERTPAPRSESSQVDFYRAGRRGAAGGRRPGGHAGRPPRRGAHAGRHRRGPHQRRQRQRRAGDHPRRRPGADRGVDLSVAPRRRPRCRHSDGWPGRRRHRR